MNYKSHSTLPENLNVSAENWPLTDIRQYIILIFLLNTLFSASKCFIIYTYTPRNYCPPILCVSVRKIYQ